MLTVKEKLIIVEGKDDIGFIDALCRHSNVTDYQIKETEGKSGYSASIAAIWKEPGYKSNVNSIGIIRDANDNFSRTFQSVQTALRNSDLPVPGEPLKPAINNNTSLRVNVFIMPDNGSKGILEDLLLQSVEQKPAMPCVNKYFTCLNENGMNPRMSSKARTQTYLAAQIKCGISIGVAASRGYWPFIQDDFKDIINFIKNL